MLTSYPLIKGQLVYPEETAILHFHKVSLDSDILFKVWF